MRKKERHKPSALQAGSPPASTPSGRLQTPGSGKNLIYKGAAIAVLCWLVVVAAGMLFRPTVRDFENMLVDARMRLPHPVIPDSNIAFVDIDDRSIELLGRWPWPRSRMAEVVRTLDGAGIWGIFIDVLFAEETTAEEDLALVRALEEAERVFLGVGVQFVNHDAAGAASISSPAILQTLAYDMSIKENVKFPKAGRAVTPLSALVAIADGIGHISFVPDEDGIARHLPLFVEVEGKCFPSIDIELARSLLNVEKKDVEIFPGKYVLLKGA